MEYAAIYYVPNPTIEIWIFVDEPKNDKLPANAILIAESVVTPEETVSIVDGYFVLGQSQQGA